MTVEFIGEDKPDVQTGTLSIESTDAANTLTISLNSLAQTKLNVTQTGNGTVTCQATGQANAQACVDGQIYPQNIKVTLTATSGTATDTIQWSGCTIDSTNPARCQVSTGTSATKDVNVAFIAIGLPVVSIDNTSLSFGDVGIGLDSVVQSFTITNGGQVGVADLSIGSLNNTAFTIQTNTCNTALAVTANCSVSVVFKPTQAGVVNASLEVSAKDLNKQTVALAGTGICLSTLSINTEAHCNLLNGVWDNGICKESSTQLPMLSPVFSISSKGDTSCTTAAFAGGIALEGGTAQLDNQNLVRKGQLLTISGSITPDAAHVGQAADILVVGLHRLPETIVTGEDLCDPNKGDFYMLQESTFSDDYCEWDTSLAEWENQVVCNPDKDNPRRAFTAQNYWDRWDGKLGGLLPMKSGVTLTQEAMLFDGSTLPVLYQDNPDYTGHVCITFGYRLADNTIVFNGEPIRYRVNAQ